MSFETTVDLRLRPSVRLLKWISTLHMVPLAVLPFAMQPGPALWALIAAFAGSWFWLRRHPSLGFGKRAVVRIIWGADDSWTLIQADGSQHAALLRPDSTRHPNLLVLRYAIKGAGSCTRLIAGDELEPESLRHLRARLSVWKPAAAPSAP